MEIFLTTMGAIFTGLVVVIGIMVMVGGIKVTKELDQ